MDVGAAQTFEGYSVLPTKCIPTTKIGREECARLSFSQAFAVFQPGDTVPKIYWETLLGKAVYKKAMTLGDYNTSKSIRRRPKKGLVEAGAFICDLGGEVFSASSAPAYNSGERHTIEGLHMHW